jgi:hypothetical protein
LRGFVSAAVTRLVRGLGRGEGTAYDQLRERVRVPATGLWDRLNVLRDGERQVRLPDAPAERLPVDLRVPAA